MIWKKISWRTSEVSELFFLPIFFFLLVFLCCYFDCPPKILSTWFHRKHTYCTMQPGEWFLSGPVYVAEVIDRVLEDGIQGKEENWVKYGWLSVMTKSATASILSKIKSYSKQKERLHAYQPRNLWIVLFMFYHLIIQVFKLKWENIIRNATIVFLLKFQNVTYCLFYHICHSSIHLSPEFKSSWGVKMVAASLQHFEVLRGVRDVTLRQWGHSRAETGAGEPAVTGTGAGVKPQTPSSGPVRLSSCTDGTEHSWALLLRVTGMIFPCLYTPCCSQSTRETLEWCCRWNEFSFS